MIRQICIVCGEVFWRVPQEAPTPHRRKIAELLCFECNAAADKRDGELLARNQRAPWVPE